MRKEEQEKIDRREKWYQDGKNAGFTYEQLDFLARYFTFWSDTPKSIEDLL